MLSVKVILHPTDFSEPASQAHATACDIAREQKAKLIVLHVTAKPVVTMIERASELPPAELQHKLWETLQCPRECEAGLGVEHRVEEGNAVQQIVRVAKEVQADMIVMGTHGQRGLLNWFTTNVTEQIVHNAHCSVLIVRTPTNDSAEGASGA